MTIEQWLALDDESRKEHLSRASLEMSLEDLGLGEIAQSLLQRLEESMSNVEGVLSVDLGLEPGSGRACFAVNYDSEQLTTPSLEIPCDFFGFPVLALELGHKQRRYKAIWSRTLGTIFGWTPNEIYTGILLSTEKFLKMRMFYYRDPMFYVAVVLTRRYLPQLKGLRLLVLRKEVEKTLSADYNENLSIAEAALIREKIEHLFFQYRNDESNP